MYLEEQLKKILDGQEEIKLMLSTPVPAVSKKEKKITYTAKTLAHELGWSRNKLYTELKSGSIRSHKVGKRVVILHDELVEDIKKFPA